jgi:hypothetical protein
MNINAYHPTIFSLTKAVVIVSLIAAAALAFCYSVSILVNNVITVHQFFLDSWNEYVNSVSLNGVCPENFVYMQFAAFLCCLFAVIAPSKENSSSIPKIILFVSAAFVYITMMVAAYNADKPIFDVFVFSLQVMLYVPLVAVLAYLLGLFIAANK